MNIQPDLFAEASPPPRNGPLPGPSSSLPAHSPRIDAPRPTPEQQRFNQLLARVEALTGEIEATRAAADAVRPAHASTLAALDREHHELMRKMALWLDDRLRGKALTANQKRHATAIIVSLAQELAGRGDDSMAQLHDRHSEDSLAVKKSAGLADMKEALEEVLGRPVPGADGEGDGPPDIEAMLHAAARAMDEQVQAGRARKQARKDARAAKKPKTAREQKAELESADAQAALRTVFRQLASALHPDRETDPTERARKSALMSEANTAYGRRDFTALLRLQLRVELADPQAIGRMADEKVRAFSLLLKNQVKALETELATIEMQTRAEFGLPSYAAVDAQALARNLAQQRESLQDDIDQMRAELALVQDDAQFKRWLREQHRLAKENDSVGELDRVLSAGGFRRG